ncbi:MAG: hypothetical protein RBS07_03615 [Lentimicrobium sp.]|jgi:hypothetical protein|nr:hypothetical protein [Lentimicrobium sp.]
MNQDIQRISLSVGKQEGPPIKPGKGGRKQRTGNKQAITKFPLKFAAEKNYNHRTILTSWEEHLNFAKRVK